MMSRSPYYDGPSESEMAIPRYSSDASREPDPENTKIGKYVYCVIETDHDEEFGPAGIGVGANGAYTVRFGRLAAVVTDSPIRIYDPTRENVLAHERVNETVMADHTVIPMSFGTIFRTEGDVVELLRSAETTFSDVMKEIRGKIEVGLKVLWDREKVVARLEGEDEGIGRLREQIDADTRNSTYFARVQLGRLIETGLEETAAGYVTEVYQALNAVSVASRSNKPCGEHMILNAAFLLERSKQPAYDDAIKKLSDAYEGHLSFRYTGPWPPYNFVNIKLKLERADA